MTAPRFGRVPVELPPIITDDITDANVTLPKLSSGVQTSLSKADTAYQAPAVIAAGATQADARTAIGAVDAAAITTAVNNLIAGAPGALDTLNELASSLGNDANFATTVTNALAGKTALSVNSVFQATYNLDTTALTASDVGAYTTAQTDAAVAAAVRVVSDNTAVGPSAQAALTTGTSNTALGSTAQAAVTTGIGNTAFGAGVQSALTTNSNSTAVGSGAQHALTSGTGNTAVGATAQNVLTTGGNNTAVGQKVQASLSTGANNVGIGYGTQFQPLANASFLTSTGNRQTSVGTETGQNTATQLDDITAIGYRATAGANSTTALGATARADHLNSVALGSATQTTATNQVMVGARDVEITDNTKGIILKSPDGTRYRITVANGGTLTVAVAP